MADVEKWIDAADRIGLTAALLIGFVTALLWLRPRAAKLVDGHVAMMDALARNSDKQTEMLDLMQQNMANGHEKTHTKLDEIHCDVKDLPRAIRDTIKG